MIIWLEDKFNIKSNSCVNCTFCSKAWRSPDDNKEKIFSLSAKEREMLLKNDCSFLRDVGLVSEYLSCAEGFWCEAISGVDQNALRIQLQKKLCPNYYPYEDAFVGVTFDGIRKLRDSKAQNSLSKKTMSFIGVLALIITVILGLFNLTKLF